MSEAIWYGLVGLGLLLTGIIMGVMMQTSDREIQEPVQQIDYSDRFDRIEAGIANSAVDVCFAWGGQWVADEQNNLIVQDVQGTQGILCIKPTQEVQ